MLNCFASRHHLLAILMAGVLVGCATQPSGSGEVDDATSDPILDTSNPASDYCVSLDGSLQIMVEPDGGEYALCHLPDGTVIEEWALYRRDHPRQK